MAEPRLGLFVTNTASSKKPFSIAKQLDSISQPDNEAAIAMDDLPKLHHHNLTFVLEKWCGSRVPRRSWIYTHGFALILAKPNQTLPVGTRFWLCHICDSRGSGSSGLFNTEKATSAAQQHLSTVHSISCLDFASVKPTADPKNIKALDTAPRELSGADPVKKFRTSLLDWCFKAAVPIDAIECPEFKQILLADSNVVQQSFAEKRVVARDWLESYYLEKKEEITGELRSATSTINISLDVCAVEHKRAVMGILAHFVSSNRCQTTRILAFRQLGEGCSSRDIGVFVLEACREFGLENNSIGYVLSKERPRLTGVSSLFEQQGVYNLSEPIGHETRDRWLCCWGHIIKSVVDSFLFPYHEPDRILATPIVKLYKVLHFVRQTPVRRSIFSGYTHGRGVDLAEFPDLPEDITSETDKEALNKPLFFMISEGLKIREAVETFSLYSTKDFCVSGTIDPNIILDDDEWACLTTIEEILRPPMAEMRRFEESSEAIISYVMLSCLEILKQLCDQRRKLVAIIQDRSDTDPKKIEDPDPAFPTTNLTSNQWYKQVCEGLDSAIKTLEAYRQKLEENPIYWSATILHPGARLKYVDFLLEDKEKVKCIRAQFEAFYQLWQHDEHIGDHSKGKSTAWEEDEDDIHGNLFENQTLEATNPNNELARYFGENPTRIKKPFEWWVQHRSSYPTLAKMAGDILSIPPTSLEAEKRIRQLRATPSDQNSLQGTSVEMMEHLRDWAL